MDAIATGGEAGAGSVRGGRLARVLLSAALAGGAGLGVLAAVAPAAVGPDDGLANLLRFMALLKAAMAMAAVAAIWWRLSLPASPPRLLGYLAATAAMAAGPGLIWGLAHVGWGALLLHGGLAAALVLLWRDPATAARLGDLLARRRSALADRAGRRGPQRGGGTGKARTSPV